MKTYDKPRLTKREALSRVTAGAGSNGGGRPPINGPVGNGQDA